MPSVWYEETICELLTYGSTLILGMGAYCEAHTGGHLVDWFISGLVHFSCTVGS